MTLVGFVPGPSYVLAEAPDDRPTRWCFLERKHLPHTWQLLDEPPERQPTYYEPITVIRCSSCGQDHTVHPGSYRDGPAWPSDEVWAALVDQARVVRSSPEWMEAIRRGFERLDALKDDADLQEPS